MYYNILKYYNNTRINNKTNYESLYFKIETKYFYILVKQFKKNPNHINCSNLKLLSSKINF